MTLYNPNYIGTYVSLLLPLFISLFISTKERKYQILYALNCVFLFISGLGCKSESARWGMTLVLLLMLVAWIKKIPKLSGRIWFVSIISTAIIATNLFYMSGMTALYSDTPTSESATENGLGEDVGEISDTSYIPISKNLKSIETLDDKLRVGYGDDFFDFSCAFGDDQFIYDILDLNGTMIDVEQVNDEYLFIITDPRFKGILFCPIAFEDGTFGVQFQINGKEWDFVNELDGEPGYYYYNEFGKFDKITTAENYLFKDHGSFGNGRGFIWGETLALLKHTLILGTGADSFALAFPQDNYVEKYLNGYETMVITKPHNMFLQVGVQNGVLALLLFLAAILIYLYKTWKSRILNVESDLSGLQVGIAVGIIGYLFTGLVNDATICITPIFWCLFGIGIVLASQHTPSKKKNK